MTRRAQRKTHVLSVRVDQAQRRALKRLMRELRLPSEAAATRYLIDLELQKEGIEETLERIRRLGRGYRGPKVNAAEEHDEPLTRV